MKFSSGAFLRALAVAWFAASALVWEARAIENKCSACIAVQNELVEVLKQERPRLHLDLRNRLNSQGKREGKIVDYKMSELRIVEVLEGLCERVKKYSLMPTKEGKKRIWMHGQLQVTDRLKLIAEEQGKELKRWCDRMVELHEDEMAEMIREEEKTSYKELPVVLCQKITNNCKTNETYQKEVKRMAPHWPGAEKEEEKSDGPKIEVNEVSSNTKDGESSEGTDKDESGGLPEEKSKAEL